MHAMTTDVQKAIEQLCGHDGDGFRDLSFTSSRKDGDEVPICRRLISRAFSPHQLISLIEEIFTRKEEVNVISGLDRDAAQAFIDVVHEVRPSVVFISVARPDHPCPLHFRTFPSHQSVFRCSRSPITAQEEVFDCFMLDMRPPCLASEITANPTLLRSIRYPVVLWWVRRRVEGRTPRLPCGGQGIEGLLNERLWQDHQCGFPQPVEMAH